MYLGSSIGRAVVSKTKGCKFDSYSGCQRFSIAPLAELVDAPGLGPGILGCRSSSLLGGTTMKLALTDGV